MIQVVVMFDCASNFGVFEVRSSRGDATYTVSLHGSESPAHCTCQSFKYSGSKQTCKHIAAVWRGACLYNPQWRDATEEPAIRPVGYTYQHFAEGTCACGGPLVAVRRAV